MKPPRIFVDARFVSSAPSSSHARYLRELVGEWVRAADGPEILLYAPAPLPAGLPGNPRVRWVSPSRTVSRLGRRAEGGRAWLNSMFTLSSVRARPDALFFPYPFAPRLIVAPAVVTIHDVCFHTQPSAFVDGGRSLDARARHAMRSATEIVAVSEAARAGVVQAYGVDARRVSVVHHGIGPTFTAATSTDDPALKAAVGVRSPYILCVSTHELRKNLETLARAYVALVEASDASPGELILVGRRSGLTADIESILAASPRAVAATRMVQGVSDAHLAALYRGAAVVAVPSLCEGFGLPLLEALASGAPVVATDQAVFRELVGDQARYVPAVDVGAWAAALRRVLDDPECVLAARQAAPTIATRFNWRSSARATLDVLERVARRRG